MDGANPGRNDVRRHIDDTMEKVIAVARANVHVGRLFVEMYKKLNGLKGPTEYVENLQDNAGNILSRQWLGNVRAILRHIDDIAAQWPPIKKRNWLFQRLYSSLCLTSWLSCLCGPCCLFLSLDLIMAYEDLISRIDSLEKDFQTVVLASNLERLRSETASTKPDP